MKQQRTAANVLKREVSVTVREHSAAPAQAVFDVLADLSGHPGWGGAGASMLLSMDAPQGQATAGTEFTSTAEDAVCRIRDSSVITEAVRPSRFEQVTESALESRKNGEPANWLLVHRYEIQPVGDRSDVTCTCRLVRASALPGIRVMFGLPLLRSLAAFEWAQASRAGLRRLIAEAERAARA
jgi:hypothetical protein